MPRRLLAGLLLALPMLPACGASEPPEEAIASTFLRFLDALAREDGGDATEEVSRATREWFQEAVDRAVEEDLAGARPAMRFAVHAARMTWEPGRLARMDGDELLAAMVGEGWVHRHLDGEVAFEVVLVEEAAAQVALGAPNQPRRRQLRFVLEDSRWRLDLAAHEREADALADEVYRWAGGLETDAVAMLIGR